MWTVTKIGRSTHPFPPERNSKYFLRKPDGMRIGRWTITSFTRFNTKSEARKAFNAKVMYAINNWGHDYVKNWIYGVEKITD